MRNWYVVTAACVLGLFPHSLRADQKIVLSGDIRNFDADPTDGDFTRNDLPVQRMWFDVTPGTKIFFDVLAWEGQYYKGPGMDLNGDGEITDMNAQLIIYRDGVLFSGDADNGSSTEGYADGSISYFDPQVTTTFTEGGRYMLVLGKEFVFYDDAMRGYALDRWYTQTGDTDIHGDWQLTMTILSGSLSNLEFTPLPEPGSALFGAAVGLVGLASRRRRLIA